MRDMAGHSAATHDHIAHTSLETTPTWAVAAACSVFVLISVLLERSIHHLRKWLRRRKHRGLDKALSKIKDELMLLGFISLLLTVFQTRVGHFCIAERLTILMLPCKATHRAPPTSSPAISHENMNVTTSADHPRDLAPVSPETSSCPIGTAPLLATESIHQLHIFIFLLATVHVLLSAFTMLLGRCKISSWKVWERETVNVDNYGPAKSKGEEYRYAARDEVIKQRLDSRWWRIVLLRWMVSFCRQLTGNSVTKKEYGALLRGFISAHIHSHREDDFHASMMRSLENDFKKLVGIRGYQWIFVIIFLLLNLKGLQTYFWMAFLPLILVLVVSTKVQHIITMLALELQQKDIPLQGENAIRFKNTLFWWHGPKHILHILHFIIFQNAFEMAIFVWAWKIHGLNSCFIGNVMFITIRLIVISLVQLFMSYVTLPLYALVNQMGIKHKKAIFPKQIEATLECMVLQAHDQKKTIPIFVQSTSNSQGETPL